jgi:RNA polymerase sigma factor (sigma-70 family)
MDVIKKFSDAELVSHLRSGTDMNDPLRFMYREYFEGLAWFVINNSGSRQDAEDIFQEVMVSFIEVVQAGKFRGESTVRTFLFSLNRFAWLNELKRRGRAGQRELKYERAQDREEADVSMAIADREARTAVMKLVEALGDTCRRILVLFYYQDRSMKEILAELDYENEQVVRNKKYKCLKKLEEMVTANPALAKNLKNILHAS